MQLILLNDASIVINTHSALLREPVGSHSFHVTPIFFIIIVILLLFIWEKFFIATLLRVSYIHAVKFHTRVSWPVINVKFVYKFSDLVGFTRETISQLAHEVFRFLLAHEDGIPGLFKYFFVFLECFQLLLHILYFLGLQLHEIKLVLYVLLYGIKNERITCFLVRRHLFYQFCHLKWRSWTFLHNVG